MTDPDPAPQPIETVVLPSVPVTARYVSLTDGRPETGRVLLEPVITGWIVNEGAETTVVPSTREIELDDRGIINAGVTPGDHPDYQPSFVYRVSERLSSGTRPSYLVEVPHDADRVDLTTAARVAPPSPVVRPIDTVAGIGPDPTGDIPLVLANLIVGEPDSGDVLAWDGARWAPTQVPGASPTAVDDLSDVDSPAPTQGQALIFAGEERIWRPGEVLTPDQAAASFAHADQLGAPDGIATLDADGLLRSGQAIVDSVDGRIGPVDLSDRYAPVEHAHPDDQVDAALYGDLAQTCSRRECNITHAYNAADDATIAMGLADQPFTATELRYYCSGDTSPHELAVYAGPNPSAMTRLLLHTQPNTVNGLQQVPIQASVPAGLVAYVLRRTDSTEAALEIAATQGSYHPGLTAPPDAPGLGTTTMTSTPPSGTVDLASYSWYPLNERPWFALA